MYKIFEEIENSAKISLLAIIEGNKEDLKREGVRMLAMAMLMGEVLDYHEDDEGEGEEPQPKKRGHANTRLPYGLCKSQGIDTTGMSPKEAWEALAGRGISAKEEYRKLKERGMALKPKKSMADLRLRISEVSQNREQKQREVSHQMGLMFAQLSNNLQSSWDTMCIERGEKARKKFGSIEEARAKRSQLSDEKDKNYKKICQNTEKIKELYDKAEGLEKGTEERRKIDEELQGLVSENARIEEVYDEQSVKLRELENAILDLTAEEVSREKEKARSEKREEAKEKLKEIYKSVDDNNKEYYDAIKEAFPTVNDCETPEDVSQYLLATGVLDGHDKSISSLQKRYNVVGSGGAWAGNDPVNLSGCSLEMARATAKVIESSAQKIPAFKQALTSFETVERSDSAYAGCSRTGNGILLNTRYYSDEKAFEETYQETLMDMYDEDGCQVIRKDKNTGEIIRLSGPYGEPRYSWHPKGTTKDSVVVHEMSHALSNWITWKKTGKRPLDVSAIEHYSNEVVKATAKKFKKTKSTIWKDISVYAKKNTSEWFAEALSLYLCGDGTNEVANFAGQYVENTLKEMGY